MKVILSLVFVLLFLGFCFTGCTQEKSKKCTGFFRWDVKTLTDQEGSGLISKPPFDSTLDQLSQVAPPVKMFILSKKDAYLPRFSNEKYLVRVIAYIEKVKVKSDQDLHLNLASPNFKVTMIGEIPDPDCPGMDNYPELRDKFRNVRKQGEEIKELIRKTKKPVLVEIIGIPFWDAPHFWLKGSSKTGREIHPILNIRVLKE